MIKILTALPKVTKQNNVFYIDGIDTSTIPDWIQLYNCRPAFILNKYTRKCFAHDIMPLIQQGKIEIELSLLDEIRYFQQNPKRLIPVDIVIPDKINLKQHQLTALQYISQYDRFQFHLGPGTGKTLIAICAIMMHKPCNTLIVTPKAVKEQFRDEIKKYLQPYFDKKLIDDIVITNYEQLNNVKNYAFDMVIVDEAHKAKNYSSIANKNLREIANNAKNVYLFTGTPLDHGRHEILPQIAILDTRVMPLKTITNERYFEIDQYYQPSKEIQSRVNELTEIIKAYTWGKQTDECIELPEEENIKILCKQPPQEYYDLLKHRVIELGGGTVVADNKATLRIKLREMCCGHVTIEKSVEEEPGITSSKNEIVRIENHKIAQLRNIILTVKRGLIFTEFIEDVDIIRYVINQSTPFKVATLKDKTKMFNPIKEFKDGNIDFLILNSKSGGTGLDMSCADNIIFYSLPESYILFYQAKMRIRRYGQTKPCKYYYLLCKNSVEIQLYGALLKKQSFTNKQFKIYN